MKYLRLHICVFSFFWTYISVADGKFITKIPPYVHTCKRSDPNINECFKKFFESLESKFSTGIPELGMPQMEPLKRDTFSFKLPGNGKNRMECSNVVIHGLSKLKIQDISINPETLQIKMKASLPAIHVEGMYDVDAHLMNMVLKGRGPFQGNASDIIVHSTADAKLIEKDGQMVLHVEHADGDITWKKQYLKIENLFPEKKANDAFMNMINGPAGQSMVKSQMPVLRTIVITTIKQYLNEVLERFPYDVIFQP